MEFFQRGLSIVTSHLRGCDFCDDVRQGDCVKRVTENRNTSTMRSFKIFSRWRHLLFSISQFNSVTLTLNLTLTQTLALNQALMKCLKFDSLLNTSFKTLKPA